MIAKIAWPPDTPRTSFPNAFFEGDPFDWYWPEIQSISCPECGFTVNWIIHKNEFADQNEEIRNDIKLQLKFQHDHGNCPTHPQPNW